LWASGYRGGTLSVRATRILVTLWGCPARPRHAPSHLLDLDVLLDLTSVNRMPANESVHAAASSRLRRTLLALGSDPGELIGAQGICLTGTSRPTVSGADGASPAGMSR